MQISSIVDFNDLYISVCFLDQNADQPAIENLLRNCSRYKEELLICGNLEDAFEEYKHLKAAREMGCPVNRALLNNYRYFYICAKRLCKNITLS